MINLIIYIIKHLVISIYISKFVSNLANIITITQHYYYSVETNHKNILYNSLINIQIHPRSGLHQNIDSEREVKKSPIQISFSPYRHRWYKSLFYTSDLNSADLRIVEQPIIGKYDPLSFHVETDYRSCLTTIDVQESSQWDKIWLEHGRDPRDPTTTSQTGVGVFTAGSTKYNTIGQATAKPPAITLRLIILSVARYMLQSLRIVRERSLHRDFDEHQRVPRTMILNIWY